MGAFSGRRPPSQYTPVYFGTLLTALRQAINNIDAANFPTKIGASAILTDNSVSETLLAQAVKDKLVIPVFESHLPMLLLAAATTTVSTTGAEVGSRVHFDPANWPTGAQLFFEAVLANANVAATTTLSFIHAGSGATLATLTTTAVALTRLRSAAIALPATAGEIYMTLKTSNATYAASCLSARVIIKSR